ncbi:MAG: segregation/condensation protein A [Candidatus Melainabacteria bacterium]|nr:segregation/condensation protein A [Candidatus Melainabacteria bacterium]
MDNISQTEKALELGTRSSDHQAQECGPHLGGIEILIDLARSGEIDPKNIDIIDVTDKFLKAVAAAPKENLRQSGKILLHASVLLRMKAEALLSSSFADADDFLEFDSEGSPIIYDSHLEPVARQITLADLERALVRRSKSKQLRQRQVTLDQLITALREAERIERARGQKQTVPRIDLEGQPEVNDVDDILELAHDEDIELIITRVEDILSKSLADGEMLPFIKLIEYLGERRHWVEAFLAVLFLANAGKVGLEQQEFYGPLYLLREAPQVVPEKMAIG